MPAYEGTGFAAVQAATRGRASAPEQEPPRRRGLAVAHGAGVVRAPPPLDAVQVLPAPRPPPPLTAQPTDNVIFHNLRVLKLS